MDTRIRLALAFAGAAISLGSAASARPAPSYATDFEAEAVLMPEWSTNITGETAGLTKHLGNFGNQSAILTLGLTAGAQYQLQFDFYALDTWDGNSTQWGPDRFHVHADGVQIFNHTFSNISTNSQSYQGPALFYLQDRGYHWSGDSGYRITANFVAGAPETELEFFATGLQIMADESWALDNVSVTRIPAPGALALFGAAGFTAARRRSR